MGTDTTETTTAPVVELPESWSSYLTPFASALGKDLNEVTALLKSVVGDPSDEAIALLKNPQMSPDADLKAALMGVPSAVQNRAIALLRDVAPAQTGASTAVPFMDVLPETLDDTSLLASLRAGGILHVDQSTVISALRTALAYRSGLYSAPALLVKAMEAFADQNDQPVPAEFFKLRKMLTRRDFSELFETLEGMDGSFVTDARKKQLLSRIDEFLWPALVAYHTQLKGWMESWQQGAMNPAVMMSLFAGGQAGMPPGMMAPPDSGALRDASEAFADAVNKVFAGTGIQIAGALAVEASQIKVILEDSRLPALIGAANRDMMLKQLGLVVSANYPRLETNLTRYALGVMKVSAIPAGIEEQQYFTALFMLGQNINWSELGAKAPTRRSDS